MKVLFIDPPGVDAPKKGVGINLAVAALGAQLLKYGHKVSLYDMANHAENRPLKNITRSLEVFDPDVIGISILNAQYVNAVNIIKELRAMTDAVIMAGGAEITAVGEQIFKDTDNALDIAMLGEGEETLLRVLDMLEKNDSGALGEIPGLIIKRGDVLIRTKPQEMVKDLNVLPPPELGFFGIKKLRLYKAMASRGCPFNCSFCFNYLGRTWRNRDPELVVNELEDARKKYDIKEFRFLDPTFNFRPEWVKALCDRISSSKVADLPWEALGVRADKLSDDLARKMAESGCEKVAIGVESLDEDVFKMIKKGETIDQLKDGVRNAVKYFKKVSVFIIIGLPGDTLEKSLYTYNEVKKLRPHNIAFAIAVPYSGTRMKKWVDENARSFGDSYSCFTRGADAFESGVAFETDEFTKAERQKVFRILHTKEFKYVSRSKIHPYLNPFVFFMEALKYDRTNIHRHIVRIPLNFASDIFKLLKKRIFGNFSEEEIVYKRVPDGTWYLGHEN